MENFHLNEQVKKQRKGNPTFIGAAEKIKQIPKISKPIAPKKEKAIEPLKEEIKEVKKEKPTISLIKGFSVGITDDNMIKFIPFGKPNRLELVGFSEYVRVRMEDLLSQIADTFAVNKLGAMKDLSDGVKVIAQGMTVLLKKDQG